LVNIAPRVESIGASDTSPEGLDSVLIINGLPLNCNVLKIKCNLRLLSTS
jgi:hypothetical protein